MVSSLRKRGLVAAGVAIALILSSRWYLSQLWFGVVVSGAGDPDVNGYYKSREPYVSEYVKISPRASSWRVPNIFDLIAGGPERRADDDGVRYILRRDPEGWWGLTHSGLPPGSALYVSRTRNPFDRNPPSSGWEQFTRPDTQDRAPLPVPEVRTCGKRLPLEAEKAYSYVELADGISEMLSFPSTSVLLAANLIAAYYLWAKRVSPDAVAISYSAFWGNREYWRAVTASFSHFEVLHLAFNMVGLWNLRFLELLLGSLRHFYLSLNLVVTTIVLVILAKHFLVKYRGLDAHREAKAVGYSCVLFAYMVCVAVAQKEFCPVQSFLPRLCFATWFIPTFPGFPPLAVNLGPFVLLFMVQFIMPRAGFLGHLAGIVMGYPMAWHLLDRISIPILAGASVIAMLAHSEGWARKMPDYSLLLHAWAAGDPSRVRRTRFLYAAFVGHVLLAASSMALFSWGVCVAEALVLVVGYNAVQAMKCCCCPDSVQAEHRYCVNLLKGYGTLCCLLLATDLMSLGAISGQWEFLVWTGVSGSSLTVGVVWLVVASLIHGAAIAGCVGGIVFFRDGQAFLSSIGLGQLVVVHSISTASSAQYTGSSVASTNAAGFHRGGGRVLGTAASNARAGSAAVGGRFADSLSRMGVGRVNAASQALRGIRGVTGPLDVDFEEGDGAPLIPKGADGRNVPGGSTSAREVEV